MAALNGVLNCHGAPVLPVPADDPRETELLTTSLWVGEEVRGPGDREDDGDREDIALVIATSGTTGTPKGALLTASALKASASATHERLGGPGTWLLALPAHHIAGIQVLVRSVLAGTVPISLDLSSGFDPGELPRAVAELGSGRRYTSLVASQLAKALENPAATEALGELDAVLLGGGPAPRPILERAAAAGITVVRTYGSSETAGGCIYDGLPLDGVRVRIDGAGDEPGRIVIGGVTLAKGYRNPPDPDPFSEPGWFHTDDVGLLDDAGRLTVLGRIDEAISTGGLTVLPAVVEAALSRHPSVAECAVFGIADDRLGQRVVAAVVLKPGMTTLPLAEVREFVAGSLDRTAAPRELHIIDSLPRRGIGKLDRRALRQRFGG
jgi:O-succinylbenzoic acid--CoA ligase